MGEVKKNVNSLKTERRKDDGQQVVRKGNLNLRFKKMNKLSLLSFIILNNIKFVWLVFKLGKYFKMQLPAEICMLLYISFNSVA